jgi:hypothetical protein
MCQHCKAAQKDRAVIARSVFQRRSSAKVHGGSAANSGGNDITTRFRLLRSAAMTKGAQKVPGTLRVPGTFWLTFKTGISRLENASK